MMSESKIQEPNRDHGAPPLDSSGSPHSLTGYMGISSLERMKTVDALVLRQTANRIELSRSQRPTMQRTRIDPGEPCLCSSLCVPPSIALHWTPKVKVG